MHNKIDFEQLAEKFKYIHIDNCTDDYQRTSVFGKYGFSNYKITEFCGEAGTGKTNICIYTMVKSALQGLNSLYLSVNHNFPSKRLKDFLFDVPNNQISEITNKRIFHFSFFSFAEFNDFYQNLQDYIYKYSINLVFIDSIASLIETEFTDNNNNLDMEKRNNYLTSFTNKARDLIYQYGLFFFIVNNMRDDFNENQNLNNTSYPVPNLNETSMLNESNSFYESFQQKKLTPYLGMRWAEEIDNRILLYKTNSDKRKRLVIDFADNMEDYECDFEIKGDQVVFYPRKEF